MQFCLIAFFVVGFFILNIILKQRKDDLKIRTMLEDNWGRLPINDIKAEDFSCIASYHENLEDGLGSNMCIDDITWNDLDMDKIFRVVNNTVSTPGEEYLYDLLRRPVFDERELKERSRLIGFFQKNKATRQSIQYILAKLDKSRQLRISDFFTGIDEIRHNKKKIYILLAVLLFVSMVITKIDVSIGLPALILIFITNATVYYRTKNSIEHIFAPMGYIIQMISAANSITKLDMAEFGEYREKLLKSVSKLKKVNGKSFRLLYKTQDPITEYLKTMLLVELISFESTYNFLKKNLDEIKNIYEILGYLDSMISIASYREYLSHYCEPEFIVYKDGKGLVLEAAELFHPLLKEPKTYSFTFDKPVLLTGSNASGKSTFLKSAAINAILAQTITTCLAKEFKLSGFMVYTSMALRDNVESKESYFIAELKSLKRIIDAVEAGIPCMCVVDEVLRGTNTIERISASSEVLGSLNRENCLCLAATHDIELTTILEDVFDNYHFREEVTEENTVVFNYTLYQGRSNTKNALKLLRIMGYNGNTVKRAQERSDKFIREGVWDKVELGKIPG